VQVLPIALVAQAPPTQSAPSGTSSAAGAASSSAAAVSSESNGNGNGNGNSTADDQEKIGFVRGVLKAYKDALFPPPSSGDEQEPKRRALPEPWKSPPFPGHEFQGYPLIGVPPEPISNPLMMGIYNSCAGDFFKRSKIGIEGWVTSSYNWSQDRQSNSPTSYWIQPRNLEMDQAVLRFYRQLDSVQTDHIDWGFRSTFVYGEDYRYLTAGGWLSNQLLVNNRFYGFDPTEQYFDVYIPHILDGMIIRVGRWIACPDIETQFAPDNYLASHSILFTYDTYTQTGVLLTFKTGDQWLWQIGIDAGNDMAPWYKGANPSGFIGIRWVSKDNWTAFYTCLNQINGAQFRHFEVNGQPAGHDNFNYIVTTWEQKLNQSGTFHTKTESYFMWQRDAELGGTPSLGNPQPFGGGGGDGALLPGISYTYGVLNYTMYAFSKKDYLCLRNEYWRDERGMRSGFPGTYTSHTLGWSHTFNSVMQFRPEIGYYRNWTEPAFDLGARNGMWMAGFDFTIRF
jgi:hypothetical protein